MDTCQYRAVSFPYHAICVSECEELTLDRQWATLPICSVRLADHSALYTAQNSYPLAVKRM